MSCIEIIEENQNVIIDDKETITVPDDAVDVVEVGTQGAPGATGATGATGAPGDPGVGVPPGGTFGQFLQKGDKGDYDTLWADVVAGVNSVSNSDGTLTITPTGGDVVASLNLNKTNTWAARQTFGNNISFGGAPLAVSGLVNGDNLQYNGTNWVNRKSYYSQIQFGRVQFNSVAAGVLLTSSVTFSPTFAGTPFVLSCVDDSSNYITSPYAAATFVRGRTASGCTVGFVSPAISGTAPNYGIIWMAIL